MGEREKRQIVQDCLHDRQTSADAILNALHQGGWAIVPKGEIERLREALVLIAQDMALSAESHRLIAQDIVGGFKERGER